MVLFVDETENENLFLVGGVLVESKEEVHAAYKRFKRRIKDYPITNRFRTEVFREFKSTLLDKRYQRIKSRMVEEIADLDCKIIYACFKKSELKFDQELKEKVYMELLARISSSIDEDISIVFDAFNVPSFDEKVVRELSKQKAVQAIMPQNSQSEPGLQLIDNICSVLRYYKTSGEKNDWYKMLENKILEV